MRAAPIGHKAISASAGSGKTFQLAHRYIELMSKGVKPDHIIALTFSRKAAGEIFDSVVGYLCQAAASQDKAIQKGNLIGNPGAGQQDFLEILRELLDNLHRLHIITLDSFATGIARNFPLELGIPPHFQLLGEHGAEGDVRKQVLTKAFGQRKVDRTVRDGFLGAYRQATFGEVGKGTGEKLDNLISTHQGQYQIIPRAIAWGREERIWSQDSPWWKNIMDLDTATSRLMKLLQEDGLPDSSVQRWQAFSGAVKSFDSGSSWSQDIDYLFKKLSPHIQSLHSGTLSLSLGRFSQSLSEEECSLVLALLSHIVNTKIKVALQKTQGLFRLLELYEKSYDSVLRQHGLLTFQDIQYLLTSGNKASGGAVISRLPSAESRLYIDYRLDCKLDHWLLDEFQDTSDLQWEVLQNLADEILQDNSGQRSFFYVGDTKQAIYSWRGGNAQLFDKILERYGERIHLSHLRYSYRSCQPVIDTVNRIFENIPDDLLPEDTIRQWERSWKTHRCAEGAVPTPGYAALIEPPSDQGKVKPVDEDRFRVVADLIKETDPLHRGLSAAVLVRSNRSGEELVDYLRRECPDMSILHEGRAFIKDNPLVSVIMSLVKFAAHPGDMRAWRHLQMSPLQKFFIKGKLNRQNLSLILLHEIQEAGFQFFIRNWGDRLNSLHPIDGFGIKRLYELTGAAIQFDRTGSRDCNSFLRFIDNYEIHDLASTEAIRVMTIHQSKGLGFDVVILPDLQKGNMRGGGQPGFVIAHDPESEEPVWALDMPRRIVAETDGVLAKQLRTMDREAAFDSLCLLYVAITRARQGLYIVTGFPGKTSATLTPASFLKQRLTGNPKAVLGRIKRNLSGEMVLLYESGDPDWYTKITGKREKSVPEKTERLAPDFHRRPSLRRKFTHIQPSRREIIIKKASSFFDHANRDNRDLGIALHELFEKISWIDNTDIEEIIHDWVFKSTIKEDLKSKAVDLFRKSIAAPEIFDALTRLSDHDRLWRENRFEIIVDKGWISGVFDRVQISYDRNSRPQNATIIDFKSDEISGEAAITVHAERYRPQMELYRRVLSEKLEINPEKITLKILFLRSGKAYQLP